MTTISFDGPAEVALYRLLTLRAGLAFEMSTGAKMGRGPSCYTLAKREHGFKGDKATVLAQLDALIAQARGDAPRVCPMCGARAVVPLAADVAAAQPDGTTHVCHPDHGGCDQGFAPR